MLNLIYAIEGFLCHMTVYGPSFLKFPSLRLQVKIHKYLESKGLPKCKGE